MENQPIAFPSHWRYQYETVVFDLTSVHHTRAVSKRAITDSDLVTWAVYRENYEERNSPPLLWSDGERALYHGGDPRRTALVVGNNPSNVLYVVGLRNIVCEKPKFVATKDKVFSATVAVTDIVHQGGALMWWYLDDGFMTVEFGFDDEEDLLTWKLNQ